MCDKAREGRKWRCMGGGCGVDAPNAENTMALPNREKPSAMEVKEMVGVGLA